MRASLRRAIPIVVVLSIVHFVAGRYLLNHYLGLGFARGDRGLPLTTTEQFLERTAYLMHMPFFAVAAPLAWLELPRFFGDWVFFGVHSLLWGVVLYCIGLYVWRSLYIAWTRLSIRWSERGANAPRRSA